MGSPAELKSNTDQYRGSASKFIWRDSGNIRLDSGNIRRDSGKIRGYSDYGNLNNIDDDNKFVNNNNDIEHAYTGEIESFI